MKRAINSLLVLLMLTALALTSSAAFAQQSGPGGAGGARDEENEDQGEVTSLVISPENQEAALAYWTREAIGEAEAMAMPVQTEAATIDAAALEAPGNTGPGQSIPAGKPAPNANAIAMAAYPEDWAKLREAAALEAPADQMAGTSQIYTSYIANWDPVMQYVYPHVWIGRLTFNTPDGGSSCSATAISNNTIVTAAHCVYDTTNNRWYGNWVFAPAYRYGSAPYGTFAANTCWVLNNWINRSGNYSISGWARYDVAVCTVGTNSAGTTLNNAVGWAGRNWDWPYVRHYHNLGYPVVDYNWNYLPYGGEFLRTCVAESFQLTTETRGMGCDLGGGISGGPWMVNYAAGTISGNVDGVNSGLVIGTQNIYAGRFNSSNIVPLCNAAGC